MNHEQHTTTTPAPGAFAMAEMSEAKTEGSPVLDQHYDELEESLQARRAAKVRKTRMNRVIWWAVILALPIGGAIFFATSEKAQSLAGQAWGDLTMAADTDKLMESYDEGLAKIGERNNEVMRGATSLGVDSNAPLNVEIAAQFDNQISDFAGGERTGIDRDRELRARFGDVKRPSDLRK